MPCESVRGKASGEVASTALPWMEWLLQNSRGKLYHKSDSSLHSIGIRMFKHERLLAGAQQRMTFRVLGVSHQFDGLIRGHPLVQGSSPADFAKVSRTGIRSKGGESRCLGQTTFFTWGLGMK